DKWRSIRLIRADDDCEISYCIIKNSEQVGRYNNPDSRGGAIYGSDCDDLVVSHNVFCYNSAPGEGGAACFYNCTGEFSNNHVYDNYGFTEIVWFEASDMPVLNNVVERNVGDHGAGIFIAETSQLVAGNIIRFNESTVMQWGAALYFAYGSRSRVYNNLIYGNISGAIYLGVDCRITDFDHNVIFDNSEGPAITLFGRSHLEINNSVIWGHNRALWMPDDGNSMEAQYSLVEDYEDEEIELGEGMIDANPRFIDPDEGNFRLAHNSPCIDSGDPDSPRDPNGTRADIGLVRFNFNELAVDDQTNGRQIAPDEYNLSAPYPNPFNDRSQITFS
ncbi:MAG: right-handed parallel beta-helix repeat-containing protein, partial [Candidatus Electryoneaceae bacterium]|nr:right-handed parallel beta-helix repeat-containing protein [Candidatus Electryoneaceae bacterium]